MNKALLSLGFAALTACAAQAAPLAAFNFDNPAAPLDPSYVSPCCVTVTDLYPCCFTQSFYPSGGVGNSGYVGLSGWDKTQYDPTVYMQRDSLYQWPKTVTTELNVASTSTVSNLGLSLDYNRANSGSPSFIQATIFWEDTAGIIQNWSTGPVNLVGQGSWNSLTFNFLGGSAPLPTGLATSGETFLYELYAWGGDGSTNGALYLDNVTITGDCAPIPEPGGAILVAAAGFAMLLRRRSRK